MSKNVLVADRLCVVLTQEEAGIRPQPRAGVAICDICYARSLYNTTLGFFGVHRATGLSVGSRGGGRHEVTLMKACSRMRRRNVVLPKANITRSVGPGVALHRPTSVHPSRGSSFQSTTAPLRPALAPALPVLYRSSQPWVVSDFHL